MSLDNTPKIDWKTLDGVLNTDLNNIGKNLNELENTKAELDDDVTFTDVDTTTATIGTATITTAITGTINNSGYVTSNYKSSDGSVGINDEFNTDRAGGGSYTWTIKDGLIVNKETNLP